MKKVPFTGTITITDENGKTTEIKGSGHISYNEPVARQDGSLPLSKGATNLKNLVEG